MGDRRGALGSPAPRDPPRPRDGRAVAWRVAALVGALVLGAAIGMALERLVGTAWGYVAVPLAVVVLWWRFADPTQCTADASRPGAPRGADR